MFLISVFFQRWTDDSLSYSSIDTRRSWAKAVAFWRCHEINVDCVGRLDDDIPVRNKEVMNTTLTKSSFVDLYEPSIKFNLCILKRAVFKIKKPSLCLNVKFLDFQFSSLNNDTVSVTGDLNLFHDCSWFDFNAELAGLEVIIVWRNVVGDLVGGFLDQNMLK